MNACRRLLATIFALALLVSVARAASSSAQALKRDAAGADDFSRAADGSAERAALALGAPVAVAADAAPSAGLTVVSAGRPDRAVVPPAVFIPRRTPPAQKPLRRSALAAAALEGGLVLALVAAGLWRTLPATDAAFVATPTIVDPVVSSLATHGARAVAAPSPVPVPPVAPTAATSTFRLEAPTAVSSGAEPFVDARMPVGTWRAISQREQALIESWNLSREKALGLASLEQWLDAHPAAGVDAAALKTKLARA